MTGEQVPSQDRGNGLVWRVPLWLVVALLLCWACAAVTGYIRQDIPKISDPIFYGPAVALSVTAAWALGLFSAPITARGKIWVVLVGVLLPVMFFVIAIIAVIVGWEAGVESPPPIAQGQDFGAEGMPMPRPAWSSVLKKYFPTGSSEKKLIVELKEQGFKIDGANHVAAMSYQETPICRNYLSIQWTLTSDGRIANVDGSSLGACL